MWATVSCGVATCWPTHTDLQDHLLEAADKALYEAKDSGRNCVRYGEAIMERFAASGMRKLFAEPLAKTG